MLYVVSCVYISIYDGNLISTLYSLELKCSFNEIKMGAKKWLRKKGCEKQVCEKKKFRSKQQQ